MLRVSVLGPLVIMSDGDRRYEPVGMVGELLGLLALNPSRSSREYLAECLWPDDEPARVRQRLNTVVWRLRRQVTSSDLVVVSHGDGGISLNRDAGFECDLDVLNQAYRVVLGNRDANAVSPDEVVQVERAVQVHRGELLRGVMSEWVFPVRDRAAWMYEQCLGFLLNHVLDSERVKERIDWADRLLTLNPFSEEAHRALVGLYTASGQPQRALKQHARLSNLLDEEFSAVPSVYGDLAHRGAGGPDRGIGAVDHNVVAILQLIAVEERRVAELLSVLAQAIGVLVEGDESSRWNHR